MTNWQTKKLGDLMTFIPTGAHSRSDMKTSAGGDEVFNIHYGDIHTKYSTYVDLDKHRVPVLKKDDARNNMMLQEGDLVVADASEDYAGVGSAVELRNISGRKVIGGLHTFALRSNQVLAPGFAGLMIQNPIAHRRLMQMSVYSKVYGLTKTSLASLELSFPENPEQQRIMGVLEVWDEYIEKLEQKIALKEQLKKGLMQQLLTGKYRLPSFSEKWIVRKMGEFAKESRVKESDNDVHKRLTVRLHLKGVEARGVRGTEAVDSTQYYRRSAGQLIYGKQNIFKGSIGVVPALYDGYASSQDIPSFDIEEAVANVYYIYYYLSRKSIYEWLENFAGGSGSKRLHTSEFYNIKIQLPSLEEQNAIVEVLQLALKEIETLKKHRDVLTKQKKYLLRNLITGTIRTPEDLQPLDTSRLERSAL